MANRRHHHTCRCNDCVRRRNAHRQHRESEDIAQGRPSPFGSTWYEVERNESVIYEDDALQREQTEREQLQDLERILETVQSEPESSRGEREHEARQRLEEWQQQEKRRPQAEESELADPNQQPSDGSQPREEADGQRWRRAQEQYLEAARRQREEEERRRQARAASREAERHLREEESNRQISERGRTEDVETEAVGSLPGQTVPAHLKSTRKSCFVPILIVFAVLIASAAIGFLYL